MKRVVSSLAMLWVFAVSTGARADVPPGDVEFCSGKSAGTACQTEEGKGGACGDGTCSRARPDGSVEYACFRCIEGAAPTTTSPKKGGCAGGSDAAGGALIAVALGLGAWRGRRRAAR